ncbi:ADP-ribosylglycohydrolase family protein [Anaerophaga thermohalophila]|uniref:ADP-ribosylglycohydrolase family protein n=1 Tax=Anaerophaga thermohalophila TaxID=177400 RepID=UPI000237C817|nr:ADP-ribosylglycohydrolase family protein [Anaerophaga thermohalophila]
MIGAIIGDIVGSRFEFNNYRETDFELFTPESTFTDDTVCTTAVAEWIIQSSQKGVTSGERFAGILKDWCLRYPNESYGAQFSRWIASPEPFPKPYNSFGNGAAMRISPVGCYFSSLDSVYTASDMVTGVTHNHPEGMKGARAVAELMFLARRGATKKELKHLAEEKYKYDLSASCDEIRVTNEFDETCQVTVPQAITAFLESDDFESAIRLAVSVGGDSDTIAAITGGIAETFYKDISHELIGAAMARLPEDIRSVIYEFYEFLYLNDPITFGDIFNNL